MKRKTLYANVDVDVDYDVEFEDLLELIDSCDHEELEKIRKQIGPKDTGFNVRNLYDEMKLKVLQTAFEKYDLEELKDKLNIND